MDKGKNQGRVCAQPVLGIDASRANSDRRTGVEWYAYHVIQRLKKIVPPSVRVVLYSDAPLRDGLENLPPNWESRVLRWPPRRLWTQIRLSWETLVRPPDALFVPAHAMPLLYFGRAATTIHDVAFMVRPEAYGRFEVWYQRFITWFATRRAERLFTVSEFSRSEITRLFGADPAKLTVTHLGFDEARCRPTTDDEVAAALTRYHVERPYFLFVGRLEDKKNLGGLLSAYRVFADAGGRENLLLVGKRGVGYETGMMALDGAPQVRKRVIEPGYVCEDDMRPIFAGATALVLPSWYEGFGLPVIEAFACGTPVICSSVTSLPEVGGDAVAYIDPAKPDTLVEQMRRIADDAAFRQDLVSKGRARSARFSWDKTAEATWVELNRLLRPKCD